MQTESVDLNSKQDNISVTIGLGSTSNNSPCFFGSLNSSAQGTANDHNTEKYTLGNVPMEMLANMIFFLVRKTRKRSAVCGQVRPT